MHTDPADAPYWDPAALEAEARRVYELCHGCRMCFNLCPSFPTLFALYDTHEGDVSAVPFARFDQVVDECFQCKLCYVKCPYTPPHAWDLDFPRLVLRARAQRARRDGVTRADTLLGNPDLIGRWGCLSAPLSNIAMQNPANRVLMEKVTGISRHRDLPPFARPTFRAWFRGHARRRRAARLASAAALPVTFFHTCSVNWNVPDIGRAAVRMLERSGCEVSCPPQRCCGMPALDGGDMDTAREWARENVAALLPAARAGHAIVVAGPTCSYTLKQEYPALVGGEDAALVATQVRDLGEFLVERARAGALPRTFTRPMGHIALHVPCHLRAQNVGHPSAELLRLLPRTTVETIEQCSGIDGTWGLKAEYFEASRKVAAKLIRGIEHTVPRLVSTDCSLAAIQIQQMSGRRPLHPVQILDAAYDDATPEALAALHAAIVAPPAAAPDLSPDALRR